MTRKDVPRQLRAFYCLSATVWILIVTARIVTTLDVHISVTLTNDDSYMFSIRRVQPALEYAINVTLKRMRIVPNINFVIRFRDGRCSEPDGINEAIKFYMERQVDVFFGPVCDYSVAPVARQVKFWNIPLLTVGAIASNFREKQYNLITRVNCHTDTLASLIVTLTRNFGWKKLAQLYMPTGRDDIMPHYCHIMTSGVHVHISRANIENVYNKFQAGGPVPDLVKLIGTQYADNGHSCRFDDESTLRIYRIDYDNLPETTVVDLIIVGISPSRHFMYCNFRAEGKLEDKKAKFQKNRRSFLVYSK